MRRVFVIMMLLTAGPVFALELPDNVGEWKTVTTNIIPLITEYNNEAHGRVTYRTYVRENPSSTLDVILTEGTGTGNLYVPEKVNDTPGMMPSDSGYERLTVSGHDAIIEAQSFMPLALAVNAGDNITLTLESPSLSRDDIVRIAEEILSSWKNTKSDSFPAR